MGWEERAWRRRRAGGAPRGARAAAGSPSRSGDRQRWRVTGGAKQQSPTRLQHRGAKRAVDETSFSHTRPTTDHHRGAWHALRRRRRSGRMTAGHWHCLTADDCRAHPAPLCPLPSAHSAVDAPPTDPRRRPLRAMPLSATPSLTVPSARHHDASRSPSPANRVHSRSPHPYRRKQQPTPPRALSTGTPYSLTPASSRRPSPRRGKSSGVSESGTEADDELARRLPAPPMPRRTSSEDDEIYHGNDEGDDRGRRPLRKDLPPESQWKRYGLRFMRRLIELALAVLLAGMVLTSREGRVWREVSARRKGCRIYNSCVGRRC